MEGVVGGGNLYSILRRYAEELGVKLADEDLQNLTSYCLHEWGGPPPENLNVIRDLFSAYLHYISRSEEGKSIESFPPARGRFLKRMMAFFSPSEADQTTIPYEELTCPECANTVVVGDLAVIDHYIKHFKQIEVDKKVIADLGDYRGLKPRSKLAAYKIARRYFNEKKRG
ncbi:MAG: hypothetical protein QXG25_02735 [Nitrososphaerota archaeon]